MSLLQIKTIFKLFCKTWFYLLLKEKEVESFCEMFYGRLVWPDESGHFGRFGLENSAFRRCWKRMGYKDFYGRFSKITQRTWHCFTFYPSDMCVSWKEALLDAGVLPTKCDKNKKRSRWGIVVDWLLQIFGNYFGLWQDLCDISWRGQQKRASIPFVVHLSTWEIIEKGKRREYLSLFVFPT